MAEAAGPAVQARPGAPHFPLDPTEPHWRWHAERVCGVLERARDPQVRAWLIPMLDTFRLRFVALNERLDAGEAPTVTDHDWRAFFDLQEKIERHVRLEGNPVDGAVNHVLRRFGQVPVFGVVDSRVWKELLKPEQIRQGMRPISRSNERRVGQWEWDGASATWRVRRRWNVFDWAARHLVERFGEGWAVALAVGVGVGLPVTLGFVLHVVSRWFR